MDRGRPSKKIFLLIIACVIGVSTIGFAVYATKPNAETQNSPLLANENSKTLELVEKALKENANLDTDQDGLQTWEETLWGTKPDNRDTDGDGTTDGAEVEQNRNPIVAGPNDKLSNSNTNTKTGKTGVEAKTNAEIKLETTETAKISRELFANYIEAKQSGIPMSADLQETLIAQTFSNKSLNTSFKKYSAGEIRIAPGADLKKYGNDLGQAFYQGRAKDAVTEIEILHKALTENKPEEIKKMDPIIKGYSAILNSLDNVSVPKDILPLHLDLLNTTSKVVGNIKGMRVMFEDPVVGLASVGSYYQDLEAFQIAIRNIVTELESRGMVYEPSEFGYVFMRIIR